MADNYDNNYNYNDNNTGTNNNSRRKAIILIIAAMLLVAVVAVAALKMTGGAEDKKYADNIAIAEKALTEGDYEAAEAGYLGAIEVKPKDVPAREGLAYVYAVEGKYDEAEEVYQDLFEDTGDSKYSVAADNSKNSIRPSDPELIPVKGIWLDADKHSLPEQDQLASFLVWFSQFYYSQEGPDGEYGKEYDSEDPLDSNLLNVSIYMIQQLPYPGNGNDKWHEGSDPRGWVEWTDFGYLSIDKESDDWMLTNIFNISEENLEKMLAKSEADKMLYLQDGRYYDVNYIITGLGVLCVEVISVRTDGEKYIIEYETGMPLNWDNTEGIDVELDHSSSTQHFYSVMELKTIDGKQYWSMYSNSEQPPELGN